MKKKYLCLVVAALLFAAVLHADAPCSGAYEKAKASIVDARLGRGLEMKLLTKVDNAWRVFRSGKKNAQKNAADDLDNALNLLDKNSTKQIPPEIRAAVQQAIAAFKQCIEGGTVTTATLTVRVTRHDIETGGTALVAGAIVRVNGEEVATTSSAGTATVDVPAGHTDLLAIVYPMEGATASVDLAAGTATTVDLPLTDREEHENTSLVLAEAPDGALPSTFNSFTLRFVDPTGASVPMRSIEEIQLRNIGGTGSTYWPQLFGVAADGSIQATNVTAWRSALNAQGGKLELAASAIDTRGRVHWGTFTFYLARFTMAGQLAAPPSNPTLNLGGIYVFASVLNTDLVFRTVSNADGSFSLPLLPGGNIEIDANTIAGGQNYYGDAVVTLNGNLRVIVNMLHTTDKINGVPLYQTEPLTLGMSALGPAPDAAGDPDRLVRSVTEGFGFFPTAVTTVDPGSVTVSVSGAARDQAVTQNATLTIPQGTPSVVLRYEVHTREYPYYVLSQSQYNDWWYLEVTAATNGARLFRRLRQINSQLSLEPIWQSNGSTGDLQYELDTQTLTQSGPADINVLAVTANIGDGVLPTTVTATLSLNFDVSINYIDHDTVSPTNGLSDRFSIPRTGDSNYFQRTLTFGVHKPTGSTISNVKVFEEGVAGFTPFLLAPSNPIVDEAPGSGNVTAVGTTGNDYSVRVTFSGTGSPFSTDPPQARRLKYKIQITADNNGATKNATRETESFYPLWRMPTGFARYGQPADLGLDDWCTFATYYWLDANRSLISSINDISGEHARNIGHRAHYEGREIDVYHYYHYAGAVSATDNYFALARAVSRSFDADPAISGPARASVTAWVSAMRQALDGFSARYEVERLYTTLGGTQFGNREGFGESLLTTGACTFGTQQLDTGLGDWNCSKCRFNHIHDNHIHITLTDQF
jgi:hypothetical protein